MTTLVFLDRDGTINKDENYFLGSSPSWKKQVKILPKVVTGIKLLNHISDLELFIITNQSGVALMGPEFDLLDEKRMHEVNQFIIDKLRQKGAIVKGYFACPYVDNKYVEKAKNKGRVVNLAYVKDKHPDLKPSIGMLKKAAESIGRSIDDCKIYFVGDRSTDVEMGLNANGTGILISSFKTKELGDLAKVEDFQKRYGTRVYVAKDFLDAANYIKQNT
jgi:histidinol-phosphate phosphatase family protein